MNSRSLPLAFAVISAVLFGIGTPFAKVLVEDVEPVVLAGLLYLGAFSGLTIYLLVGSAVRKKDATAEPLRRTDVLWLAGATLSGGVVAPICLMTGLTLTTGFSASLMLNLEGLATAVIAYLIFRENVGWRLGVAIVCMTAAGVLLSWDPSASALTLSGPLLLLAAGIAWGIDNNLTRHISSRNPFQISRIKGLVAGTVSLSIALVLGFGIPVGRSLIFALALGSVSYGASLVFFILALQGMGAARTGAFYSIGPFVGAAASLVLLEESLIWTMLPAALLMLVGMMAIVYERHSHVHEHEEVIHTHLHSHDDLSHDHTHESLRTGQHIHEHTHHADSHDHVHWPDIHHRHDHG
jgi:drug/metabolite transporter (DMT)-like permease